MTVRGRLSCTNVDGHRRYADEPEPSWYSGQGQYPNPAPSPYDSGVHERPSGAFRLPEQRESDYATPSPYVTPDPVTSTGSHSQDQVRIPVRGPEYPTIRPTGGSSLADAPPSGTYGGGAAAPASGAPSSGAPASSPPSPSDPGLEQTGPVPPISRFAGGLRPSDAVYRTRRPMSAVLVGIATLALMVPVVTLLVQAMFDDDPLASGVVPAVLLTLGLPLTGLGLYALARGGPVGRDAWLRPPLAYLPVGLVLLIAAALAVG
jgi:hypothetical protein